jgi:hypothetical protein
MHIRNVRPEAAVAHDAVQRIVLGDLVIRAPQRAVSTELVILRSWRRGFPQALCNYMPNVQVREAILKLFQAAHEWWQFLLQSSNQLITIPMTRIFELRDIVFGSTKPSAYPEQVRACAYNLVLNDVMADFGPRLCLVLGISSSLLSPLFLAPLLQKPFLFLANQTHAIFNELRRTPNGARVR